MLCVLLAACEFDVFKSPPKTAGCLEAGARAPKAQGAQGRFGFAAEPSKATPAKRRAACQTTPAKRRRADTPSVAQRRGAEVATAPSTVKQGDADVSAATPAGMTKRLEV